MKVFPAIFPLNLYKLWENAGEMEADMRKRWTALWLLCLLLCLLFAEKSVTVDGVVQIPSETYYVALTFDDGPRKGTTDRLLDGLRERGASATFFLVGERAAQYPELLRRMSAEGHQVGNHTWSHVRLEGAPADVIREEVGRSEALLEGVLGGEGYWLRPPYGLISSETKSLIPVPMITWSVDPRDWESQNTEKVVQAVLRDVQPNSIILLHDIYGTSVKAALQIIDILSEKGYVFVTVEELMRLNGRTPEQGKLYRSGEI